MELTILETHNCNLLYYQIQKLHLQMGKLIEIVALIAIR